MSSQSGSVGLSESNIKELQVRQINKLSITSNDSSITLPQDAHILLITLKETAGNSITGGIDIGTTNAGTDIVSGFAVAGNSLSSITDAALLKRIFAASQQLFLQAHTGWNNATLNINIIYATRSIYGT